MRKGMYLKKFLCIMLSMALLTTMMPMTAFGNTESSTDPTMIDHVALTVEESLMLTGQSYSEEIYGTSGITCRDDTYTVESVILQDGGGTLLTEGMQLQDGFEYKFLITLAAESGYAFLKDQTLAGVNNTLANVVAYANEENTGDGPMNRVQIEWGFFPTGITISQVFLDNVLEPAVGEAITDYSYTHVEQEKTQYTVSGTWNVYNPEAKTYAAAGTGTFENGKIYQLALTIETKPGFMLDYYTQVMVNGVDCGSMVSDATAFAKNVLLEYPLGMTEIPEVLISKDAIPTPVPGQTFSDTVIDVPVSDDRYTANGYWMSEDGDRAGTFAKGKLYYFCCSIYPKEGYCFTQNVNMNNVLWSSMHTVTPAKIECYITRSLKTPIDQVVLTGVPEAKVGETLPVGESPLTVPSDAKYKATGYWSYDGSPIETEMTVQSGKCYEFWIQIDPAEGYELAEFYTLCVNGSKEIRNGGSFDQFCRNYSFLQKIDKVDVTGFKVPVLDAVPSTETLQVPAGAGYEIERAEWLDCGTHEPVTTFESGHSYYLNVYLNAKEGYEFAASAPFTMGDTTGLLEPFVSAFANFTSKDYSFEQVISKVEISNIPTKKVGETAKMDVDVPSDAPYTADALWSVWDEEHERFIAFTGTFEKDKTYEMFLSVRSKGGYRFDEETTVFYVDGKETKPDSIASYFMDYFYSYPSETEQVIKNVEVTIEKPVSGNHASVRPVIVLPDGANFIVGDIVDWMVKIGDKDMFYMDYFVDGADYGVHFNLTAKKGYVFDDDLKIKVNGTTLPDESMNPGMKSVSGTYFFSMAPDPEPEPDPTPTPTPDPGTGEGGGTTPGVTPTPDPTPTPTPTPDPTPTPEPTPDPGTGEGGGTMPGVTPTPDPTPTPAPGTGEGGGTTPGITPTPDPTPTPAPGTTPGITPTPDPTPTVKPVKTVSLSATKYIYNGKVKTPTVTVKDTDGNKLTVNQDYTVTYAKGRKNVGRYKVTVNFIGKYQGSKTLYFNILPKAATKVKANLRTVTGGYDDVKVTWKKSTGATGYNVYYKKASAKKYTFLKAVTGTSVIKKDLKDGVKYQLKVVPYFKSGGKKYLSTKSSVVSVTTLKKVTNVKVKKSGSKVKVSWKNINGETGYQISKMTKKKATQKKPLTYKTTKGTYKKLSAVKGKTYYYKVRAYKTVDGKKVFGPWSTAKEFKRK